VTTRIKHNGTYAVDYRARRFLADGTDCADGDILGFCEISVVVLTHGEPDDSFGVSSVADRPSLSASGPSAPRTTSSRH
jgi:hypothetical protein